MTPRERMIATLNHQKPDRVPIQVGWRDEVMEAVKRHYRVDTSQEVEQILEADLYRDCGVKTRWPDYERRVNGELRGEFGHIGRTVLHDERTFEDRWGVVERVGEDRKYLQWVSGPFVGEDDLAASRQRRDRAEVGEVAGAEEQRRLIALEAGQPALELAV